MQSPTSSFLRNALCKAQDTNITNDRLLINQNVITGQDIDINTQQLYQYYKQNTDIDGIPHFKTKRVCPVCAKTFYDRSTWVRHMRIHSNDKPYPCKHCGREFRANYNKNNHEKKCLLPNTNALYINQKSDGVQSEALKDNLTHNILPVDKNIIQPSQYPTSNLQTTL